MPIYEYACKECNHRLDALQKVADAPLVDSVFRDYFFLPQWISAEVDLDPDAVYNGNSPSRRRDLRKLSTNELSYRVTTNREDLEHFYQAMYLPTMQAAHGNGAVLMEFQSMLDRIEVGESELVYISNGNRPIAGSLIVFDDGEPRLLSLGVLNADRNYYLELTYNKDGRDYELGDQFGHVALLVDDLPAVLEDVKAKGWWYRESKPEGRYVFVKDPNGYDIEILEAR